MILQDPEGVEMRTTTKYVDFGGKDVLDVGCGEGRLTFKFASSARHIMAIDPDTKSIKEARKNTPRELVSKVEFRVGKAEELPFSDQSFDVVCFTWSLCCMATPYMKKALYEAWRVLKTDGVLVNLQPSLLQPFQRGAITHMIRKTFGTLEEYMEARYALKHVTLIDEKFKLFAEKQFTFNTYYDSVEEALSDLSEDDQKQYSKLNKKVKNSITKRFESMRTEKGILNVENIVLTVLKKNMK